MYQRRGISLWNLIISLTIVYSIMPIVSRFISTYLTTYFYLLVVVVVFLGIVLGNGSRSLNEYAGGILVPFILFYSLSYFNRTDSIVMWGYSVLLALVPLVAGYYIIYYQTQNISFFAMIIVTSLLCTAVTTSIGLVRFPYAARILATIVSSQDAAAITYDWNNIGGYNFVYFLVLLYPILILAFKRRRINIFLMVICTVLFFLTVILSEYATALLLLILSSMLIVVKRDLRRNDIFVLFFLVIIVTLIFGNFLSNLLSYIGQLTGSETVAERFNALAGGQAGLENSESDRIFLYQKSINTFLSHPLLGTFLNGGYGLGGHSFILDTLGRYGLIGLILLIYMYRKMYRLFVKPFENEQGYGYVLWTFLQAIMLSTINTGMWVEVIALMMPILVCWIYGYGELVYEDPVDY